MPEQRIALPVLHGEKLGLGLANSPNGPIIALVQAGTALDKQLQTGDLVLRLEIDGVAQNLSNDDHMRVSNRLSETNAQPNRVLVVSRAAQEVIRSTSREIELPKGELKIGFFDSGYGPMVIHVFEDSPLKTKLSPGEVVTEIKVDGVLQNDASGWRTKDGLACILSEAKDKKRHITVWNLHASGTPAPGPTGPQLRSEAPADAAESVTKAPSAAVAATTSATPAGNEIARARKLVREYIDVLRGEAALAPTHRQAIVAQLRMSCAVVRRLLSQEVAREAQAARKPRAVVFDFDCTLTRNHLYKSMNKQYNYPIRSAGRPQEQQEVEWHVLRDLELGAGWDTASFYDWIWGGADRLAVVRAMLATFKTTGIPVYIATKGDAGEVASILKHAGLEDYIAVVRDHHEGPKQRYILPWIAENPGGLWFVDDDHTNFDGLPENDSVLHMIRWLQRDAYGMSEEQMAKLVIEVLES